MPALGSLDVDQARNRVLVFKHRQVELGCLCWWGLALPVVSIPGDAVHIGNGHV